MKFAITLILSSAVFLTFFELGYFISPTHERNGFSVRNRAAEIRISDVHLDYEFDLFTMEDGRLHRIGTDIPLIEANDGFIFGTLDVTGYIRAILNQRSEPVKLCRNRLFDIPVLLGPGDTEFYYIDLLFLEALNLVHSAHRVRDRHPENGDRNSHPHHGGINGH